MPSDEFDYKYAPLASFEDAEAEWATAYARAGTTCSHGLQCQTAGCVSGMRQQQRFVVTGPVLPLWCRARVPNHPCCIYACGGAFAVIVLPTSCVKGESGRVLPEVQDKDSPARADQSTAKRAPRWHREWRAALTRISHAADHHIASNPRRARPHLPTPAHTYTHPHPPTPTTTDTHPHMRS
jgi:hypothetical protein